MTKFENRHLYIGGSELAVIMGISPFKKRIELALEKAQVVANTFEGNEATRRGDKLEKSVIELFEKKTGLQVTDSQKTFERPATDKCLKLLAHVDGICSDGSIFEAKTTDIKSKSWGNGIPDYYKTQLNFYMNLAGVDKSYIAVAYCNGDEIVDFQYYEYKKEMTMDEIIAICEEFTSEVEEHKSLGVINTGEIIKSDIDNALIDELNSLDEKIKSVKSLASPLEKRKKEIESLIKIQIGNNAGIENDLYKITLGNRITIPSTELKITRSNLKIEYKN